jgi:hypothetical protein
VSDARKKLRVTVTAKDSRESTKKNHKGCAMAVACKREFHLSGVVISRQRAYLVTGDKAVRYSLPSSVSREVVSFDRGGGFAEGEYELVKPPKVITESSKPRIKSEAEKKANNARETKFVHQTTGIRTNIRSKDATF